MNLRRISRRIVIFFFHPGDSVDKPLDGIRVFLWVVLPISVTLCLLLISGLFMEMFFQVDVLWYEHTLCGLGVLGVLYLVERFDDYYREWALKRLLREDD